MATNIGLQRSLNGGVDWTTLISGVVWDICFHPTEATIVYALVHQDMPERCSFQRSDDSGETFTLYDDGYFTPSDQGEADDNDLTAEDRVELARKKADLEREEMLL